MTVRCRGCRWRWSGGGVRGVPRPRHSRRVPGRCTASGGGVRYSSLGFTIVIASCSASISPSSTVFPTLRAAKRVAGRY